MTRSLTGSLVLGLCVVVASPGCSQEKHEKAVEAVGERPRAVDPDAMLPGRVKTGFDRQFLGGRITDVRREEFPNGGVHYHVRLVDKDGREREAQFDETGRLLPEH